MKVALAVLIAVVVLAIAVWFRARSTTRAGIKLQSTEQFVEWLAAETVKDASEQSHVNLDYSVDSIKQVEQILGGLHEQYAKNPASVSVKGLGSASLSPSNASNGLS